MPMKTTLILITTFFSFSTFAMPNPQFVPLMNMVAFGKYIEDNMEDIVRSSSDLARVAIPNSHYFLVTKSITIIPFDPKVEQGLSPFATLNMSDIIGLNCSRDIYTTVKSDQWGENREVTFTLSPTIRCSLSPLATLSNTL